MTKRLSETDRSVLEHFGGRFDFCPDGALFWNGVRRQAANRLVKRGLLERTAHPKTEGYKLTDAGREWLSTGRLSDKDAAKGGEHG